MSSFSAPPPGPAHRGGTTRPPHFRAHERRTVRLSISLTAERTRSVRQAAVVDVSLAGAGLETEEELVQGERVEMAFTTPALWDPLTIWGVVTWAEPPHATGTTDPLGRPRIACRAGVAFEYPDPQAVLAMFELLAALTYD